MPKGKDKPKSKGTRKQFIEVGGVKVPIPKPFYADKERSMFGAVAKTLKKLKERKKRREKDDVWKGYRKLD